MIRGRVVRCGAHGVEATLAGARLGDRVVVASAGGSVPASVAGIDGRRALLSVLGESCGISAGDAVGLEPGGGRIVLGTALLGRAVDGLGRPLDGGPAPCGPRYLLRPADAPLLARRIGTSPLWTGIRAIDSLLTIARGARIGLFGPPGCGKSVLLERIAAGIDADAVVVALVGERAAEARRRLSFIDRRTSLVCAPADRTPAERLAAGQLAMAQAERLRAAGLHVALIFDSLARFAGAARELGLGAGEAVGRGGYPASAFACTASLVERAGSVGSGSVTLIATVLTEMGDPADPLAEAVRSFLDGHLVLDRGRADRGAFPALDCVGSLSRTMAAVVGPAHAAAAAKVRGALARFEAAAEARELGISPPEPALERAFEAFLRQGEEPVTPADTVVSLGVLADTL